MKTAILSWGSLVNSGISRGLRIIGGWNTGGPLLPIEFSRVSQSGNREKCLTLVIDEVNGCDVPTQYATSSFSNLDISITNLRLVENISLKYSIGYVNLVRGIERGWSLQHEPLSCVRIKDWARQHDFDAVIWTSLLPNFEKITEIPFTVDNAVRYVKSLPTPYKELAKNYILSSPSNILTPVKTILIRDWMEEQENVRDVDTNSFPVEETLMRFLNRFRFHRQ